MTAQEFEQYKGKYVTTNKTKYKVVGYSSKLNDPSVIVDLEDSPGWSSEDLVKSDVVFESPKGGYWYIHKWYVNKK